MSALGAIFTRELRLAFAGGGGPGRSCARGGVRAAIDSQSR